MYLRINRPQEALADLNKAVELDPGDPGAYFNRGIAHNRQGQFDKAAADFTRFIAAKDDLAVAYFYRGTSYLHMGRHQDALADYERAVKLEPSSVHLNARASVLATLKRFPEALQDLNKALELDPNNAEAYNNRGAVKAQIGQSSDAMNDIVRAAQLGHKLAQEGLARFQQAGSYALQMFPQLKTLADMQQFAAKMPIILEEPFILLATKTIHEQIPPAQRPIYQQRLEWIMQMRKQ